MLIRLLFISLLAIAFSACVSNQLAKGGKLAPPSNNTIEADAVSDPMDLTDYLMRVSGVRVFGQGSGATVRIRGPQSFIAEEGPLFVVNGIQLGYDYSTVFNSIAVRDIQRVVVLKNASDTGMYGVRGATGVIEIYLKGAQTR